MFEIVYIKEMTCEDGSKVDVEFTREYANEKRMYREVKRIVSDCNYDGAWMQFTYIGPKKE